MADYPTNEEVLTGLARDLSALARLEDYLSAAIFAEALGLISRAIARASRDVHAEAGQ